ncbi:MAG: S8 family serine peptidase [Paludibacteraceae bacterium]|nr:S8 family serine peptidase [Paludibacteraceae bacterium]
MKRTTLVVLCLLSVILVAYCQNYYWYKGKQIPLKIGRQRYILYEDSDKTNLDIPHIIAEGDIADYKDKKLKWGIVEQVTPITSNNVAYQIPSFYCFDTNRSLLVTHRFYVKLKSEGNLSFLQNMVHMYNAEIEEEALDLWYVIRCGLYSQYNALELANIFYESGSFAATEPEFIFTAQPNCVNDPQFFLQWNLKNTGSYGPISEGIDINYCEAHSLTTGNSSVIIGLYDNGVELTHPDINIHSFSYNVNTESSPSAVLYNGEKTYHATACAGIISAKTDNHLGVAGIAPDCPVMSLSYDHTTARRIKKGFITAADNGCAVINCAWNLDGTSHFVDEGISYALTHGRSGKGCVVVFSAGNEDCNNINYPANSNDSIIVVGAISPCGERKDSTTSCDADFSWGSNYGSVLDVMAPGNIIPTTDLVGSAGASTFDYVASFGGTSAACSHVAAIAGLILSVNPNLTQKQVADIIESTAQKVGNYNYTTHSGRPNGTWNNEMGYGLVDAHAAVFAAIDMKISGIDKLCSSAYYGLQNVPSSASISWSYETNIQQIGNYPVLQLSNTSSSSILVQRGSYQPSYGSAILYSGYVTLKATVTHEGLSRTFSKTILLHQDIAPTFPIGSLSQIGWQESRTFTINNCANVSDNYLKWVITMPNETTSTTYYGRSKTITPTHPGTLNIKLYNLENCSTALHSNYNIVVDWRIPVEPILLFPNPVTTETVEVHVVDKNYAKRIERGDAESPQLLDYTLELWDDNSRFVKSINSSLKGEEDIVKMDVSGLLNGIYILNLKMQDKITFTNKMIINH